MLAQTSAGPLHYVVDGPAEAPVVLLMHGLGTSLELWDVQAAALASRFRVIRFDTRGHGRSAVPGGDYSIDDLGSDALAVLDAAGVASAHIGGISLGALTSLWIGIHAASRVRSLFIANTAARVGTVERWEERAAMVRHEGLAVVADRAMSAWFTPGFLESHPAVVRRWRDAVASTSPVGYLGCCAALRDADLRPLLTQVSAPALVLAGQQDTSSTVADARLISDAIPGAELVELPSAHMSAVELPAEVTGQLERFLPQTLRRP